MNYTDYIIDTACRLLAIDSPTGFTDAAAQFVMDELTAMGYTPARTVKGGVLVDLDGPGDPLGDRRREDRENGLLLETHLDTLGCMVAEIKSNGRLRLTNIGGMNPNNAECENVRVVTRFDGVYEGTCQLKNASTHVNGDYSKTERTWDSVEIVLDEAVASAGDARKLGIRPGDFVCFEPRTRVTEKGYIKSRFLDDKLSVAILLGLAKYLMDEHVVPARRVWGHFTVFEEVGHGGAASVPEGVVEAVSIDMGCVGEGLECTERQVSICAKDSGGPYHHGVVQALVDAARRAGADYAVDIYPHYGSDVEATLAAGCDLRHGLIGPGVYASHGYERSHRDGVENTFKLIREYVGRA